MFQILSTPQAALITFTLFLIGYIIFIDTEGGFKDKFLSPSKLTIYKPLAKNVSCRIH